MELEEYRRYVADSLHFAPQGMYIASRYAAADDGAAEIDVDGIIGDIAARLESE